MKVYREDDWMAEVEVLKDESDSEWERYTLKIVGTLRVSRIYKPIPDGEIINVHQKRDTAFGGMWTLRDEKIVRGAYTVKGEENEIP